MSDEPLGRRLRRERERRRISLESIAADTKIGVSLLQALESEDVSRLPAGIFRRAIVRSYASAIGLDADETLTEFLQSFPDPPELASQMSSSPDGGAGGLLRRRSGIGLRLTLADSHSAGERLVRDAGVRLRASACDLAVIGAIAGAASLVLHQFWVPLAVAAMAYYPVGLLILGNTPGMFFSMPKVHLTPPIVASPASDEPLGRTVFDEVSLPMSFRSTIADVLDDRDGLRLPSPAARGAMMETLGNISRQG